MTINQVELKECFSLFATGVMIATTNVEGKNYGLTINSFSSVSMDPPLCLFSIGSESYNLDFFKKSKSFALNILSTDQLGLAKDFAAHNCSSKWNKESFNISGEGNPIFTNSNGYLECTKHQVIEAGDHHIFIGEVVDCGKLSDGDGLVYYKGGFC